MKAFSYVTAQTPESAVDHVRAHGKFIAGGIDLLGEMKENIAEPELLVNVKQLPGTCEIMSGENQWVIGANVTLAELIDHAGMQKTFPGLTEAAAEVGSPQMRTLATVGGNLAQHSRCWYYRHRDVQCLKKGGKRCFAQGGMNKYHALFSGSTCLSPCVSNLAVMLTALDARVWIQREKKLERWPLEKLYVAAWSSAKIHHSLAPTDLILRIEIPAPRGMRSTYLQMAEKSAFDWALVSCAAAGRVEAGKLRGVRVTLGAVASIPWQVKEANEFLEGKEPTEANALIAADLILRSAVPLEHNAYKIPLAKALIRRALANLVA